MTRTISANGQVIRPKSRLMNRAPASWCQIDIREAVAGKRNRAAQEARNNAEEPSSILLDIGVIETPWARQRVAGVAADMTKPFRHPTWSP